MKQTNNCPTCGYPLPPGQTVAHIQGDCIKFIAQDLKNVKEAAARTAQDLETLKTMLERK
jgi:hypothetical protein